MADNIIWIALAGFLVILMQAGFALVTSGLCRAKSAGQIISMNLVILPLVVIGFWIFGFKLMFWSVLHDPSLVASPWLVNHVTFDSIGGNSTLLGLLFFQAGAVAVAAAIPIGVMAERWKFKNFMYYGLWVGLLPIAWFADWVWGGGWLAQLGHSLDLGHGYVDFAGSSVLHMAGGTIGLVGACLLGPRVGKFSRDGRPRPMPGHNLIYVAIGTVVLAVGWFGLNLGPALAQGRDRVAIILVNTLLAGATGTVGAYFVVITKFRKPDPSMLCNGLLAGLVAISASCPFVNNIGAAIIGLAAGVLVVYSVLIFESKFNIDDPVGAVSVHGVSGAWGVLSLGLFANGSYGAGWNGIHSTAKDGVEYGVSGAFGALFGGPASDWSQLGAQALGAVVCVVFIGVFALVWFKLSALLVPLRVRREEEMAGLDLPEMGAECYPDFHLTEKSATHTE